MIYKGVVSSINGRKARILISNNNYLTNELPISNSISDIQVNDTVLVAFIQNNMVDGLIIENLSRASSGDYTVIDGGSFV